MSADRAPVRRGPRSLRQAGGAFPAPSGRTGQRPRAGHLPAAGAVRDCRTSGAGRSAVGGGPSQRGRGHHHRAQPRRGHGQPSRRVLRRAAGDRGRRFRDRCLAGWDPGGARRPGLSLDPALTLFAEAVIEPALADEDVARHVQLRLAEIEQAQANSAQLASIAFRQAVFDAECRAVPDVGRRTRDRPVDHRRSGPIVSRRQVRAARGDARACRRLRGRSTPAGRAGLRSLAAAAEAALVDQAPVPRTAAGARGSDTTLCASTTSTYCSARSRDDHQASGCSR